MRPNQLPFEELLLPHLDGAYNLARWLVETDQDAQAVVRAAFIQAKTRLEEFSETDARARLLAIVRNIARTWIEQQHNHSKTIPFRDAIPVVLSDQPADSSQELRKRELHQALSKLSFEFREILALREIEGWSYDQLGSALNLAREAVISRLSQARLRLRQEMTAAQRGGNQE
jgi:RNA polymerase sigma factor, sigma-70 family